MKRDWTMICDPKTTFRAGLMALAGMAMLGGAAVADGPHYTVAELLDACKEGLNASREHEQAAALECQQYLAGFRDAMVAAGAGGACFPHGPDRRAEMQRAFVKWGVNTGDVSGWAAADGVLAAMSCPD